MYCRYFCNCLALEKAWPFIWTNFIHFTKGWSSGFGGEDFHNYLPLEKGVALHWTNCFVLSFDPVVQEKKLLSGIFIFSWVWLTMCSIKCNLWWCHNCLILIAILVTYTNRISVTLSFVCMQPLLAYISLFMEIKNHESILNRNCECKTVLLHVHY